MAIYYHQLPSVIYDLSLDDFDEMLEYMGWEQDQRKKAEAKAKRNK